jgi:hypothetical protein
MNNSKDKMDKFEIFEEVINSDFSVDEEDLHKVWDDGYGNGQKVGRYVQITEIRESLKKMNLSEREIELIDSVLEKNRDELNKVYGGIN